MAWRKVGVKEVEGHLKLIDDPSREMLDGYEGYWFRVRSEMDENSGELKRARYGKIDGVLNFSLRRKNEPGYIAFTYYLSPDESPSLEFNGKSLVKNASLQGVTKH